MILCAYLERKLQNLSSGLVLFFLTHTEHVIVAVSNSTSFIKDLWVLAL